MGTRRRALLGLVVLAVAASTADAIRLRHGNRAAAAPPKADGQAVTPKSSRCFGKKMCDPCGRTGDKACGINEEKFGDKQVRCMYKKEARKYDGVTSFPCPVTGDKLGLTKCPVSREDCKTAEGCSWNLKKGRCVKGDAADTAADKPTDGPQTAAATTGGGDADGPAAKKTPAEKTADPAGAPGGLEEKAKKSKKSKGPRWPAVRPPSDRVNGHCFPEEQRFCHDSARVPGTGRGTGKLQAFDMTLCDKEHCEPEDRSTGAAAGEKMCKPKGCKTPALIPAMCIERGADDCELAGCTYADGACADKGATPTGDEGEALGSALAAEEKARQPLVVRDPNCTDPSMREGDDCALHDGKNARGVCSLGVCMKKLGPVVMNIFDALEAAWRLRVEDFNHKLNEAKRASRKRELADKDDEAAEKEQQDALEQLQVEIEAATEAQVNQQRKNDEAAGDLECAQIKLRAARVRQTEFVAAENRRKRIRQERLTKTKAVIDDLAGKVAQCKNLKNESAVLINMMTDFEAKQTAAQYAMYAARNKALRNIAAAKAKTKEFNAAEKKSKDATAKLMKEQRITRTKVEYFQKQIKMTKTQIDEEKVQQGKEDAEADEVKKLKPDKALNFAQVRARLISLAATAEVATENIDAKCKASMLESDDVQELIASGKLCMDELLALWKKVDLKGAEAQLQKWLTEQKKILEGMKGKSLKFEERKKELKEQLLALNGATSSSQEAYEGLEERLSELQQNLESVSTAMFTNAKTAQMANEAFQSDLFAIKQELQSQKETLRECGSISTDEVEALKQNLQAAKAEFESAEEGRENERKALADQEVVAREAHKTAEAGLEATNKLKMKQQNELFSLTGNFEEAKKELLKQQDTLQSERDRTAEIEEKSIKNTLRDNGEQVDDDDAGAKKGDKSAGVDADDADAEEKVKKEDAKAASEEKKIDAAAKEQVAVVKAEAEVKKEDAEIEKKEKKAVEEGTPKPEAKKTAEAEKAAVKAEATRKKDEAAKIAQQQLAAIAKNDAAAAKKEGDKKTAEAKKAKKAETGGDDAAATKKAGKAEDKKAGAEADADDGGETGGDDVAATKKTGKAEDKKAGADDGGETGGDDAAAKKKAGKAEDKKAGAEADADDGGETGGDDAAATKKAGKAEDKKKTGAEADAAGDGGETGDKTEDKRTSEADAAADGGEAGGDDAAAKKKADKTEDKKEDKKADEDDGPCKAKIAEVCGDAPAKMSEKKCKTCVVEKIGKKELVKQVLQDAGCKNNKPKVRLQCRQVMKKKKEAAAMR